MLFDIARDVIMMAATGTLAHLTSGEAMGGAAAGIPAVLVMHWLANPAAASSAATWSRARIGVLGHPTPARLGAFSIATRDLANTLGVPVETIIKREKEQDSGTQ
jgi:hypothetical protein